MKVSMCNKKLIKEYNKFLGSISTIFSLVLVFVDIPQNDKIKLGIVFLIILFFLYLILWRKANTLTKINKIINEGNIEIKFSDFWKEEGIKVIAFNEYFDTIVDNKLITRNSLNGTLIKKYIQDINQLDQYINDELEPIEVNVNRVLGKKNRYKLGTTVEYNNFILFAFSRFNVKNEAYLTIEDYFQCLMSFWREADRIYNGRDLVIPLLGSGITRFKDCLIKKQELLELLLLTLRASNVQFMYSTKVKIILPFDLKEKINLFELRGE